MRAFEYTRAVDLTATIDALNGTPDTTLLAGGTTLLDLMKLNVMMPGALIDITSLAAADPGLSSITATERGGVRIGALALMSDTADHPLVRRRYPVVAEALLKGASAQLRNMATIGGNLRQRTRCVYFRDVTVPECNKRDPGSGCAARLGHHRLAAVVGTSEACIATHPSDVAVALVALDAVIYLTGANGQRQIGAGDFFLLPGETPWRETAITPDEVITAVELPPLPEGTRSHYLKVRDRESYEFALVSAAVAVHLTDGVVDWARLALGGVGTKPWRVPEAERVLIGQPASAPLFAAAADATLLDAVQLPHNAFKVTLARRALARALATATGLDEGEAS
jgi:xanthine dehydrogenase YagS FAD-binding subunit